MILAGSKLAKQTSEKGLKKKCHKNEISENISEKCEEKEWYKKLY